jgi:hypothetical protein
MYLKVVHGRQPLEDYFSLSLVTAILLFPETISSIPFIIFIVFSLMFSSASGKLVTGKEKANIVLEILREESTLAEISQKYDVAQPVLSC